MSLKSNLELVAVVFLIHVTELENQKKDSL